MSTKKCEIMRRATRLGLLTLVLLAWGTVDALADVDADDAAAPVTTDAVAEEDEQFRLYLDDTLVLEKTAADNTTSWELVTQLNAAQMPRLTLEYTEAIENAGVRLQWKTAISGREVLPTAAAYPAAVLDAFVALAGSGGLAAFRLDACVRRTRGWGNSASRLSRNSFRRASRNLRCSLCRFRRGLM